MRNFVAKHSFNKGGVHVDKKKEAKKMGNDENIVCPECGSEFVEYGTGWAENVGSEYQAYHCNDCGYVFGGDLDG